jgi:quercetin dioxygenase-like cupin family protein
MTNLPAPDEFAIFDGGPAIPLREMFTEVVFAPTADPGFAAVRGNGLRSLVPFCHAGEQGFSIVRVYLAPNYILPAHTHDVDCLYYVLTGEVLLGKRSIRAGGGFFVPAGKAYGYAAGPEGSEVLELRHATRFDFRETERSPARWAKVRDNAERNGGWVDAELPY